MDITVYNKYIEKIDNNNENNKIWMEFLHEHEKELYESFENDIISSKVIEK